MAELAEAGAVGFSDDGLPIRSARVMRRALQYQRLVGLPIAAPRGGPRALGGRLDARGRGLGGARARRRPVGLGVDDDRPRLRPRRLRGGAHPRPAPLGRSSRSRRSSARRRPASQVTCEATPHHLTLTDEAGPQPRLPLQDEPAAAHRGRPPGADRGAAQRARSTASRPTTPRTPRREGGAVRAGGDGGHRARDGVRRPPHRARAARACSSSARCVERLGAGAEPLGLEPPADRAGRRGEPRSSCDLDAEWEAGRRGLGEPLGELVLRRPARCAAGCSITVAAGPDRLPATRAFAMGVAA